PEDVPSLKTVVLAGEALERAHVQTWARKLRLVNGYGQTECSVLSSSYPGISHTSNPRNIGKAFGANFWLASVSNHNMLAPVGAVGELLIEGPCIGRGYLNDKAKTD